MTYPILRWLAMALLAIVVGWVAWRLPLVMRADDFAPWAVGGAVALLVFGLVLIALPQHTKDWFCEIKGISIKETYPPVEDEPRNGEAVQWAMGHALHWLTGLLEVKPPPGRPEKLLWPDSQATRTFLDVVAEDWQSRLADRCRRDILRAIESSDKWAEALLKELTRPQVGLHLENLDSVFVTHAVEEWLKQTFPDNSWADLIDSLQPKPDWLQRFFESSLAPMWPYPARQYNIDEGIAVVDGELVAASAASLPPHSRYRITKLVWPTPGRVVLVRIVQGLPEEYLMEARLEASGASR